MTSFYRNLFLVLLLAVIAGCAVVAQKHFDELYGPQRVADRTVTGEDTSTPEYYRDIKPIIDNRCVVCHGCYDAPCQLKMSSFASIDRGASTEKVYNGARLLEAKMSRLSIDAASTQQWREQGFFPVLNERTQSPQNNIELSVLQRMLALKQAHPLPESEILPDSFDFSLDRDQQCTNIESFDEYARDYPLWGMPYGLPGLEAQEQQLLEDWVANGAKASINGIAATKKQREIDRWETFFNGDSLKQRLMSRYIYEHLFLANIYFLETGTTINSQPEFFKLVRSTTAPGEDIQIIPSRRPFDDPGGDFFYRLQRVETTILAKQHMPYRFSQQRMKRWTQLFIDAKYDIVTLPSYAPEIASNPFRAFKNIPVDSRYQFMLDEAQFTIMGFIKGPVCRGQVALNVINDHFWVYFVSPEKSKQYGMDDFLARERKELGLPAEKQSSALRPVKSWRAYSAQEKRHLEAKSQQFRKSFPGGNSLGLSALWNGNGNNQNAALTVYRHYDSASVLKGLWGDKPKTAWVIDYPLLERIHYLLVAGFDVYGNFGHQLLTRMYMDFLRMEGESNFLRLLPKADAEKELAFWYRGAESNIEGHLAALYNQPYETSDITFIKDNKKFELFDRIHNYLGANVARRDDINGVPVASTATGYLKHLQQLSKVEGLPLQYLPEQSLIRLQLDNGQFELFSLVRNRAHSNVAHLVGEQKRLIPEEETLSVLQGVVGTYPNVFYQMKTTDLETFTTLLSKLNSQQDYAALVARYGIRRSNQGFWPLADSVHAHYLQHQPITAGLLDFNRLENR